MIDDAGLALIKHFEGFSPVPYRCPAGWMTIGYGHVIREGEPWTWVDTDRADALLREDVTIAERAVSCLIRVALTPYQYAALVSFTYNLGAGALQRSALRRVVNCEAHAEVPPQLMRWVFAGGKKLPGLLRRRQAESRLYQGFPPF